MLTSSLKVFVLKCKPEEIYSLLQQTSSGHLRNCTFCRFNVGLFVNKTTQKMAQRIGFY